MFNLLPKTKKEIIRREYRVRLAVVYLWLLFAALVISSLLLLPSLFLSSANERAAQLRFDTLLKSLESGNAADIDAILIDTKSQLALLESRNPKVFLYELLMLIASAQTDRLSLTGLSFGAPTEGKRDIDIAGIAQNRSVLLSFAQTLEQTGLFEKVEVPISNFAKDTDINFNVRASGAF